MIILWVSTQRALTSELISGTTGSIHSLRSQGSTDGDGSLPGKDTSDVVEVNGETPGELIIHDENAIEEVPLLHGVKCP